MSWAEVRQSLPEPMRAFLAWLEERSSEGGTCTTDMLRQAGTSGALGALVPVSHGGTAIDYAQFGELNRAVAAVSPSLQSLFTVHGMVCRALARWSGADLRDEYLPLLSRGDTIAAFALTEAEAGNDIRRIRATARSTDSGWVLDGVKKWVTFGQVAHVYLVFASCDQGDVVLLVRRDDSGVDVRPSPATFGLQGARLAELRLTGCQVPRDRIVGKVGAALSHVAADALTVGRLSVAHGALGLAQCSLTGALERSISRHQFGGPLHRQQLVRGMLADTGVAVDSASLLCRRAARSMDEDSPWAIGHVVTAKLAASRAATAAAAVEAQLFGADGLTENSRVHRHLGDARVMEVIEGSTQLLQHLVADALLARHRADAATTAEGALNDY
ncbi:acyl-CoA dehydrogenase family protein [Streptomyces sp900105245]|uniref:Acyl-CoA dehydrogenase family protein n=1 Tax=Streptomyces sp. 900105245 TaxID=3154379 RepID=A0ABV1UJ79_9ACTN